MDYLRQLGKSQWRPAQRELVEWVRAGHRVLGVLPTGHGKSLCFQVAALMSEGCSIVISPLIALMQDQVQTLRQAQVAAARYDSSISLDEREETLKQLRAGELKILYLAPEALDNEQLQSCLSKSQLGLFIIDEAHCLSAWGHSFRPDYLKLPQWSKSLAFRGTMALTATATPALVAELQQAFDIAPEHSLILSPYRDHIQRRVLVTKDKWDALLEHLRQKQHLPAIIYARSRKEVEELSTRLKAGDYPQTRAYHAGLSTEARQHIQEKFLAQKDSILVATIAFGMGIDKSDLRSVIHYDSPNSPEAYLQESGRAGRDGNKAYSLVLMNQADDIDICNRLWAEQPDPEALQRAVRWLIPPYQRIVSLWELETECDIASEVHARILSAITPHVQVESKGYKYYKIKALYPLSTILDGRSNEEKAQLTWLHQHPEGEVEGAADAWDCSYSQAMQQLQDCEAAGEWQLGFRQQAIEVRRRGEIDSNAIIQELQDYYTQRYQQAMGRWAKLQHILLQAPCINQALDAYFMGRVDSSFTCQHCGPCRGEGQAELACTSEVLNRQLPPPQEVPEFPREGQKKRFLLGLMSPTLMRKRLWNHPHYGCAAGRRHEDV